MNDKPIWVLAVASFAMGTEAFVYAGQLNALASDTGVSIATAGQRTAAFATTAGGDWPFRRRSGEAPRLHASVSASKAAAIAATTSARSCNGSKSRGAKLQTLG
ncbi:hypothetical protein [Bradyrhizobium roseum]|uniref:hypothetical protein n=1 Tax=Bradyrhizobium roseum TaxID=3056648 RepID=UPI0026350F22|nr:hypothetical protein [Bradyrhizobium roseus]WKA31439.1 hypothetical protein QUH67_15300 [Bradyrhizobium roseus]